MADDRSRSRSRSRSPERNDDNKPADDDNNAPPADDAPTNNGDDKNGGSAPPANDGGDGGNGDEVKLYVGNLDYGKLLVSITYYNYYNIYLSVCLFVCLFGRSVSWAFHSFLTSMILFSWPQKSCNIKNNNTMQPPTMHVYEKYSEPSAQP